MFFGYDDRTGRRWVNLRHVVIATFSREPPRMELYLDFGMDGKTSTKVELTGESAIRLVKIMAELEGKELPGAPK
jgi:hypothetical protein